MSLADHKVDATTPTVSTVSDCSPTVSGWFQLFANDQTKIGKTTPKVSKRNRPNSRFLINWEVFRLLSILVLFLQVEVRFCFLFLDLALGSGVMSASGLSPIWVMGGCGISGEEEGLSESPEGNDAKELLLESVESLLEDVVDVVLVAPKEMSGEDNSTSEP